MKSIFCAFLILALANLTFAEETTFSNVKVPHRTGRQTKAVLTFSDSQKAILVRPVKGDPLTVPYSELDKCSYQFSRKHRVTLGFIVLAIGADPFGFLVMLSTSKLHWLEVDYHEQDARRNFVLRMDKHNYPQILDAMKAHTGIEPEVLGNVDKRSK